MNILKIIYIFILLIVFSETWSQDPQFSQYYAAKTSLAPSFAGTTQGTRVIANFRDQWPQLPKEFITYAVSVDHALLKLNSGVGVKLMQDYAGLGSITTTNISAQYSYMIKINEFWRAIPGIEITYSNRKIDLSKLKFGDQLSFLGDRETSVEGLAREKTFYLDFANSGIIYSDKLWVGYNVEHLSKPDQSLFNASSRIPRKLSVFSGVKLFTHQGRLLNDVESIFFTFLFKMQEEYKQLDFGFFWDSNPMQIGLGYRGLPVMKTYSGYWQQDAVIAQVGYYLTNMSFSYSYDFTVSKLIASTSGSHEISVIYLFNQKKVNKRKYKPLPCPNI